MIPLLVAVAVSQQLPEVRQRLQEERAAAHKLAGREANVLGRLAELERQIEVESRALRAAEARLRAATQRLSAAEESAGKAKAQLEVATAAVEPRLVARYRLGREGYVRFLLGSTSINDLMRRSRYFNTLLQSDFEALAVLRTQALVAKAARDEVAAAHAEQDQSFKVEGERRAALQQTVDQQRILLASVQREKATHEQAARELEEAVKELSSRLAELRGSRRSHAASDTIGGKGSIRKRRGKLAFPVDLGRIEVRFGRAIDPRFGTVTLQNGIDVRAPTGSPIRAVWNGKVAHAGWFRGFGNLLIVDHGDGMFSLMAHLDQLQKALGDSVRAGEVVGTVGETGSLKGPYLYFELRDGQTPLDPERWLRRSRRGPALLAGAKGGAAK
ncbi:MAG TPA: peptidoglycan DD-metalloendopeptidase family protein [Myxococcales bacterium]|nr:peptidoglycan DD-metalloendopeptidase family protein [Myxococcales bacterium]